MLQPAAVSSTLALEYTPRSPAAASVPQKLWVGAHLCVTGAPAEASGLLHTETLEGQGHALF